MKQRRNVHRAPTVRKSVYIFSSYFLALLNTYRGSIIFLTLDEAIYFIQANELTVSTRRQAFLLFLAIYKRTITLRASRNDKRRMEWLNDEFIRIKM